MIFNHCLLPHFPDLPEKYYQEYKNSTYNLEFHPNVLSGACSFENSKLAKRINEQFNLQIWSRFHKMPSRTMYDWHKDRGGRQCALNWIIKETPNSYCFFGNHKTEFHTEEKYSGDLIYFYDIDSVEYVWKKPTLLNVRNRHLIVNNSDEDRIIMSVSLSVDYKTALKYLNGIQVTEDDLI